MTFTGLINYLQQRELDAWNALALFSNAYGDGDSYTKERRVEWLAIYYILKDNDIPQLAAGRARIQSKK